MGDIADMILDGILDEQTGEYIGEACGYPRTFQKRKFRESPQEKKVRAIRKELAILVQEKEKHCSTEKEKNKALNDARMEINIKYGKNWR